MELVVVAMLNMADDVLNVRTELKTYKETIEHRIEKIIHNIDEETK